jgi:methylmalonyl-CoA/ethylmalonyl-CoA epimerase
VILGCIHHVAYVVTDIDAALERLEARFGLEPASREVLEDDRVEVALCGPPGGAVELISPLDPEGPVARFLERRGEGMHHVAFEVDDLTAALDELRRRGVELIDEAPRAGLGGHRVAFVHPRAANGVLTELVEADGGASH